MSKPAAGDNSHADSAKSKKPPVPPEEKFWQRYSPHHEFPLSSVISICLYTLAGLLAWAVVVYAMKHMDDGGSLPVGDIVIAGGGGNEEGEGEKGAGDLPPVKRTEAAGAKKEIASSAQPTAKDVDLKDVVPDPVELLEQKDPSVRFIDESNVAMANFKQISRDARQQLMAGLGPSKGKGGSGEGGGKGKGKGKGEGDLEGDGKQTLNVRQKRVLRWVMQFNTFNGDDYLAQLRELGAILAIPDPQAGGYLVIRNLQRLPAKGEREDLADIKRIFWIDDKPPSVDSLARALGLFARPPHIVAFFPEKLEKELLQKELQYGGKREEDIKETRFRVVRRGRTYVPEVEGQR
jgi:hypothetical protein